VLACMASTKSGPLTGSRRRCSGLRHNINELIVFIASNLSMHIWMCQQSLTASQHAHSDLHSNPEHVPHDSHAAETMTTL